VSPLVLSAEEAVSIGRKIIEMTTAERAQLTITHIARGLTRVANGRVLGASDGEIVSIMLSVAAGSRGVSQATINQVDDASLREAVTQAERFALQKPAADANDWNFVPLGPQQYDPVTLWYDSTASALDTARHDVIPQMLDVMRSANLEGAGFVGGIAKTTALLRKEGMVAVSRETDMECTTTARTLDGKVSGWAGAASRDWAKLHPRRVAERAVEMAKRGMNPVAFEPGRRTVVLSPTAVAEFAREMAYAYSGLSTQKGGTPFSKRGVMGGTKLGLRVFDERLRFTSDPADPDGGYPPFYIYGMQFEGMGVPFKPVTWVDRGILKTLQWNIAEALGGGHQHHEIPQTVRIAPMPGVKTLTEDEMIANCTEGVYVNRLSSVRVLDHQSGMMTGVTRDGCFLIKNGKISKALKNFRFMESPFFVFNRVEAIGTPVRSPLSVRNDLLWPALPVITPALMVHDFNFSGLSDAV
jgi:predicted Zn-dependent protease